MRPATSRPWTDASVFTTLADATTPFTSPMVANSMVHVFLVWCSTRRTVVMLTGILPKVATILPIIAAVAP